MEDGRDLPQPELWAVLSAATATTLVGAGMMAAFMRENYRHTFYKVGELERKMPRHGNAVPLSTFYNRTKRP